MSIEEISVPFGNCGSSCAGSTFAGRDVSLSMNEETEIWKPVPGMVDVEASSLGRIKVLRGVTKKTKILTGSFHKRSGYMRLHFNGRHLLVARLVGMAFHDNPQNLPTINHKNGVKTDNRGVNLEWCSNAQNNQHAIDNGLVSPRRGERHHNAKLNEQAVAEIRAKYKQGARQYQLAATYGVDPSSISHVVNRQNWAHVGQKP